MPPIEKKYMMVKIAVIIPTFNEVDCIQKCLRQPALKGFDQVIIADCGSIDGSCEKLAKFTHFIQLNS